MLQGTTKSGFEYLIEDESLNDYELLEMFSVVDKNPLVIPRVVDKLLGSEQKQKLFDHLRSEKGIVPTDKVGEELADILAHKEVKK